MPRPQRWPDVETKTIRARMPAELAEAFQNVARTRGMPLQDLIGEYAERLTGVPYDQQGGLSLTA